MKKQYSYFFTYFYSDGLQSTHGHTHIVCNKKIESYEDIKEVAKFITEDLNFKHTPTILFFKELGKVCEE